MKQPKSTGNQQGSRSANRLGKAPATSARELALQVLQEVAEHGAYSQISLNQRLQQAQLSGVDAGLATEIVYGTIQRKRTIDYWLIRYVAKGIDKLSPWVLQLLRMSVYQLLYLERVPDHAIVNEAVNLAKKYGHSGISGMVNGILRAMIRQKADIIPENIEAKNAIERISFMHSYPKWLVKRLVATYGEQVTEAICEASNLPAPANLRINPLVTSREAVMETLEEEGYNVRLSLLSSLGIVALNGGHLASHRDHIAGRFSLQDESSMLVAEVANPKPNSQVLDLCAAPGGKSMHLAQLLQGTGKVWANDIHPHKQTLIEEQAVRLSLSNVEAIVGDALQISERFAPDSMDVVLLDAPCSGFGVIRRKPDIKWTKSAADIVEIANLQRQLLQEAAKLVKRGGVLLYSTCTIEQLENEQQITAFLAEHPQYKLDSNWSESILKVLADNNVIDDSFNGMLQLLPHHFYTDGFFIARMVRTD
ncbi:16S rRNA (cytosine(967)-C(5))-methyltransferase RsmB [Paenibacillus yanchengensis]|uniref:16S rRNA (cytosine(967)-C(5))-methyltransferase n=1 Tax=Paenibacillus yanchengensis TaxID=2035833 RepID=A0ABW4YMM8_9BACL